MLTIDVTLSTLFFDWPRVLLIHDQSFAPNGGTQSSNLGQRDLEIRLIARDFI
jgi:hypothetical protein